MIKLQFITILTLLQSKKGVAFTNVKTTPFFKSLNTNKLLRTILY